ncbi:copper chaperone PCu(A)C [Microbacterium sp. IEGM 1404]|uniref:copper chaperone PCu(A)C n=1 Tax=Microbacterium sp. IEGM 1404 TaxID=3047084 RepID=UPI0024B7E20A|nr:copper chaperone PCu(A)C [Microbacterium sp. IEGM 1404]MDI9890775.1 copper chaperone PCu(A)C [Microbacterium sp. IEGM 1404]
MSVRTTSLLRFGALALAATLALSGCAGAAAPTTSATPEADAFSTSDVWVKAADAGMSAGFGELRNDGDTDLTVVSATSPATSAMELHETVQNESGQMVMRPVEGGFVIPAHGAITLEPGGNHLMFMDVTSPLLVGDETTITLTFSDDSTAQITAPVKEFAGANETYEGDMGEMDMGSSESDH